MTSKSTPKRRRRKSTIDRPPKPYPDFPLSPANCGAWQKKIKGKLYYFGRWGRVVSGSMTRIQPDGCWEAALELYQQQRDALYAGRKPDLPGGKLTVRDWCNRFLTAKTGKLNSGEMAGRTFAEYRQTCARLVAAFGKDRPVDDLGSRDFERLRADIAKVWGPVRLGNEIQRVRTICKYALESKLIDKPVDCGPEFRKPSKSVMRKHRATNGHRLFTAAEVQGLLDAASPQLKAMILLGVNCGFGNADVASLPKSAVDLKRGWIRFPRPKTGIDRRCPLWPETVEALKAAIAERPSPKDGADAGLVFVTKYGNRWVRTQGEKQTPIDSVLLEFGKLLRLLKCNRPGLGFYALRHTFRTVADATKDFPAIRLVMGHVDNGIDDVYREQIDDSRLQAVAEHVRKWLFGDDTTSPEKETSRISDPIDPCDPPQRDKGDNAGSHGAQNRKPDAGPVLRLYAG
jgi:integrase